MRTTTATTLALASVAALLGVAVLAAAQPSTTTDSPQSASGAEHGKHQGWLAKLRAHLRFWHRHPAAAIAKTCDGNMTVDECQALLKDKLQDLKSKVQQAAEKRYEACLQEKPKDYCDGRLDQFKADHPRVYGNATA